MVAAIAPVDKVLILGAYGMLGSDLQNVYTNAELRGHELDITDGKKVSDMIKKLNPSLVINAAASSFGKPSQV